MAETIGKALSVKSAPEPRLESAPRPIAAVAADSLWPRAPVVGSSAEFVNPALLAAKGIGDALPMPVCRHICDQRNLSLVNWLNLAEVPKYPLTT